MKMIDNIRSFLYDKEYFVSMFDNCIHIFNYIELNNFSDNQISLKMNNFDIFINGKNLTIKNMAPNELLIQGIIKGIKINNE